MLLYEMFEVLKNIVYIMFYILLVGIAYGQIAYSHPASMIYARRFGKSLKSMTSETINMPDCNVLGLLLIAHRKKKTNLKLSKQLEGKEYIIPCFVDEQKADGTVTLKSGRQQFNFENCDVEFRKNGVVKVKVMILLKMENDVERWSINGIEMLPGD